MIRDVFYYGKKPNVHPREKFASSFEDAKRQNTTEHFWIINEYCDYTNFDWDFDFDFLSDEQVWTQYHINIWPSYHQKDSGTWLCHEECTDVKIYRNDVNPLKRNPTKGWVLFDKIDNSFDFSWHPDPTDPPYIYKWGCKFFPVEIKSVLEYHVEGAVNVKYMDRVVALSPNDCWVEVQEVDKAKFDMTWRPDPREPAFIYVWGNEHIDGTLKSTLEYHTPGATEIKYMSYSVPVLPEYDRWEVLDKVKNFDFTWRPDPREPVFIYVWGNKWVAGEIQPTIKYTCPGATEVKYMTNDVELLPNDKWVELQKVDKTKFDMSFRPDPTSPPYIYVWGNKYIQAELQSTIEYHVPGATDKKYMGNDVIVLPELDRWVEVQSIDRNKFDLSWRPDPREPAYIYVWGNKWIAGELKSTLEYHYPNATEYKYMGEVDVLPETEKWNIVQEVENFDFTWRPDPREPAYIYIWGNKWIPGELQSTIEYRCDGATDVKYMGDISVSVQRDRWNIVSSIDETKFDLSWRPDPREPAYIYVWGNKYVPGELKPTLEYYTPGATERKYVGDVEVLPEWEKYKILIPVDKDSFDFTWRPDPREPAYIYVWGNEFNSAEIEPTIEYYCDGATERKYMHDRVAKPLPISENWKILIPVTDFDFSWRPDPHSPPYIYVFGNQWNNSVTEPTLEYHVEGATDRKYMDIVAKVTSDPSKWKQLIPVENFDYSWRPDPNSPPYIYVFGNQWHDAMTEPTLEYHVNNATEIKYVTDMVAKVKATQENWKTLIPVENFDYSWRPNPHSPAYIYVFGNQWNDVKIESTVEYHSPGATQVKYIEDIVAFVKQNPTDSRWRRLIDVESFDYSWRPDPTSPPYIYVFGNKYNDSATEPTIEYHVEGAIEYKYITHPVAVPKAELKYWQVNNKDDLETFDFTWRPNPYSPPQIYQWEDNGPCYTVPGATDVVLMKREITERKVVNKYKIKTTIEDLINEHKDEVFWAINPDLNYDKFDFTWRPSEENFRHINVFGNEYSKNTQTYYVNGPMYMLGHREYNYVEDQQVPIDSSTLDMFFVDRYNNQSQTRYEQLKAKYPQIQKTRYLNTWVDTINRCATKSTTKFFWVLSSELDYSEFTFDFYPSPWQEKMIHVFGTQWSHWGNTYMINKESFPVDTKYVKVIEHLNVLNFVKSKKAKAVDILYDIIHINHGNMTDTDDKHVVKYNGSYITTFRDMLATLPNKKEHYVWVVSSICDYRDFDFTYICDPFSKEQLHVFPSDKQKFGDTFLVDVNKLRELIDNMSILENYNKVNFNQHQRVNRLPAPVFVTNDTHTDNLRDDYNFPYAIYVTSDNERLTKLKDFEPISLWNDSKDILITSTGGSRIIVPKEAKSYVKTELYDYPFIKTSSRLVDSKPLDIVFFSNGEVGADENYEHLLFLTASMGNRVVRVDGVQGRVKSQHAAANISETPWYFLVNAKLRVNKKFDFSWQPDRLQIPKHYIFLATNPVNGLEYGHQAIVANNKTLTLNTNVRGLDFTMDSEHEVVNVNSGIGMYNTSPWDTWRTAFREVIKLRNSDSEENKHRLTAWLTIANGDFARYSLQGAKDAIDYYESVNGDFEKLKLSYDWAWLKSYFENK